MDCQAQIVIIPGSEKFGNNHTCSHCGTTEKTYQQKGQGARRSYCRQGFTSQEITYDQRVRHIVHLLEQIAQKQRNRKGYHLFGD